MPNAALRLSLKFRRRHRSPFAKPNSLNPSTISAPAAPTTPASPAPPAPAASRRSMSTNPPKHTALSPPARRSVSRAKPHTTPAPTEPGHSQTIAGPTTTTTPSTPATPPESFATSAHHPEISAPPETIAENNRNKNRGEGGIRTREEPSTLTRFPGVRLKPLGHLTRKHLATHSRKTPRTPIKMAHYIKAQNPADK